MKIIKLKKPENQEGILECSGTPFITFSAFREEQIP